MENIKLSFIVPIYNVAPYLRMCVASLLSQDYPKEQYEIILVDDGSTDSCPEICDEYEKMFDNIRVIHQLNAGLSTARNNGIEIARGEYVCFVDSDDYWQRNVLSALMNQIERDNLDVLRFKYQYVKDNGEVFNPYKRDYRLDNDYSAEPTDGVTFLNTRMNTQCYAVMFIFRRDLIYSRLSSLGSCLFTEGIYFEDTDWTPRMLSRAKRVASTNEVVYNYLVRRGSISRANIHEKQRKVLEDKMRLIAEMQRQADELQKKGLSNAWFSCMIADTVLSIISMLSVDFYSVKDAYLHHLNTMNVFPIAKKSFKARLINLSPRLAVELLHIKNK